MARSCSSRVFPQVLLLSLTLTSVPLLGQPQAEPAASRGPDAWKNSWTRGAVFYEVFVRSFKDSNGDGKGDLKGLIEKLDYLNDGNPDTTSDLGVDALWLMPIFDAPPESYHGYDTTNYELINPDYGTNADFLLLCSEAHKRGIRIILDLVLNHSSSKHPWFLESASSPSSPYRDWYVWNTTDPGWRTPWDPYTGARTWYAKNGAYYYGAFWSEMPDLNYRSPAVRDAMKRIAALWMERGADGFRLDASRYLIETGPGGGQQDTTDTHQFWKEWTAYIRTVNPAAAIVAENWTDTRTIASYYGSTTTIPEGDELPMNFNFPLSDAIIQGINNSSAGPIAAKFADMANAYPAGVNDAPFLTNHDRQRLATQMALNSGRQRASAAVLLTVPGAPFIYYGDEIGIQNGTTGGDQRYRTPMAWDATEGGGFTSGTPWWPFAPGRDTASVAAQTNDSNSLLSRYRNLIRARKSSAALTRGDIQMATASGASTPLLVFVRQSGAERVLVAHNLSGGFASGGPYKITYAGTEVIFTDPNVSAPSGPSGAVSISLPPYGSGIWRLK